jgi:hypothetical protein
VPSDVACQLDVRPARHGLVHQVEEILVGEPRIAAETVSASTRNVAVRIIGALRRVPSDEIRRP